MQNGKVTWSCFTRSDPVCGSNGHTYSNACFLKLHTCGPDAPYVYLASRGACAVAGGIELRSLNRFRIKPILDVFSALSIYCLREVLETQNKKTCNNYFPYVLFLKLAIYIYIYKCVKYGWACGCCWLSPYILSNLCTNLVLNLLLNKIFIKQT